MTRVIHTGDTHLGYRQYHEAARRRDFLAAFRSVLADAIAEEVDAVLHAGDLFHDRRPELSDVMGAVEALRELRAAEIPFLAVVGNHEGTRSTQWLDLFERIGLAERLDREGRAVGNTTFYGLDYTPEAKRASLEYNFETPTTPHSALVAHGAFQPFDYGNWDLGSIFDAASITFDVALLGDNHEPERATVRDTPAVYCGSTERTAADQRDARGYNIITFDDEVSIRRKGLETRDFVFIDIELEPGEGGDRVRSRLKEESVTDAVVIVTITGAGERVVPADVEAVGEDEGALITRVNDRREVGGEEAAVDVSFADPDAAVRERVSELGLSGVALSVEELVRDEEVAVSSLRDRVADRVEEALENPEAFESVENSPEDSNENDDETENAEEDDSATDASESGPTEEGSEQHEEDEDQVTMEDFL